MGVNAEDWTEFDYPESLKNLKPSSRLKENEAHKKIYHRLWLEPKEISGFNVVKNNK